MRTDLAPTDFVFGPAFGLASHSPIGSEPGLWGDLTDSSMFSLQSILLERSAGWMLSEEEVQFPLQVAVFSQLPKSRSPRSMERIDKTVQALLRSCTQRMSIGPESGGKESPDDVTHGINHWRITMFSTSANRLAHKLHVTIATTTRGLCFLRFGMLGFAIAMGFAGINPSAQAQPVPAHQPTPVQPAPAQKIGIWHTNLNEARREAERLNRPLLVHFGAVWCAPCQKMERTVFNQPEVIDQLKATAVCLKIDVDKNPELAQRFGVERFPTDVILEPNGMRLMEATGYQSPEEYRALVDRAARRYAVLLAARSNRPAPPVATTPETGGNPAQVVKNANAQLMLDGYCPVTLQNTRSWKKGDSQFQTTYKDQVYQFVSAEARAEFLQAPEKYVPQFLGCDPVLIFTTDRAVPGSIEWAAYFDNHLYLFVSQDNRSAFKADPEKYLRTRVVLDVDQIESVFR